MTRALIILLLFFSIMIGCAIEKPQDPGVVEADRPASVQSITMKKAYLVLNALKEKDMEEISRFVHPQRGVLFSPFGTVDTKRAQVLMPAQVKELFQVKNQKQLEWGTEPGKREPIRLTPEAYFDEYVYHAEFSETELVTYDGTYQKKKGNDNIKAIFPNSHFVEFFVPGAEEFEGMNWKSLKLVFSIYDQEPYLVGIVHDQWTP
ncbi:hypothetical protein [Bacillus sp. RAR_GA_16]|uniref:hypothetical protein n=1 Tax=Bacillus sp. RAR_GA_16 TaxID=2876774 RepID=UPI001CC9DFDE|nr:hypothetical protein [Bacillus sp. RAR_GA_16]MCA0172434.1 hypothetical protein [Bacillus sp. RAR_GA_16]